MDEVELHASDDGYVLCPRRGEIAAVWCEGCPFLTRVERGGGRTAVVCEPGYVSADQIWATDVSGIC